MQKGTDSPWKNKMRLKFYENLSIREGFHNNFSLTKDKYDSIIEDLKLIKSSQKRDYQLIERYDLSMIEGRERLIHPEPGNNKNPKVYVHSEELFDILYNIHSSTHHAGRDKMLKHLRANYKNITRAQLKIFLELCESCHSKNKKAPRTNPVQKSYLNNKSQVTYVDFQYQPDENYKFILIYKEESTQFVILKPLISMCAKEIAYKLLDIFLIFGAPINLYLDNQNEVYTGIMDVFRPMWPQIKVFQGKSQQIQIKETDQEHREAHLNIEKILTNWMEENSTTRWSEGLRFVQFMKNQAYHVKVEKTPYEAMFGSRAKLKLALTSEQLINFKNIKEEPEGDFEMDSQMQFIKMEPSVSIESIPSLVEDPLMEDDNLFDSYSRPQEKVEAIMTDDDELPSNSKNS